MAQSIGIADQAMATPWRRRTMCILLCGGIPAPAALEAISGRGARVRSSARPETGDTILLQHPAAGRIEGRVEAVGPAALELVFAGDEPAVAFALRALAADMTRGD